MRREPEVGGHGRERGGELGNKTWKRKRRRTRRRRTEEGARETFV